MIYKFKPYSYSKISCFNSCPKKFKFQYIDKIKVQQNMDALIKGTTIHYCLENLNLKIDQYTEGMKNNIKKFPDILEIIDKFKNSELGKKYLYKIKTKPIQEFKFGLTESLEPTSYGKDALYYGIVDYVCILEQNGSDLLHICDYKSGKYKDQIYQDYNQLLFYAIYFFEKYKVKEIKISFIYVEHNLENDLILNIEHIEHYKNELMNNIKNIENCVDFKNNENILCNWCPYFITHCDSKVVPRDK